MSAAQPLSAKWPTHFLGRASYHRTAVVVRQVLALLVDILRLVALGVRSHTRLAAENLFLRKQLALYLERQLKPRRVDSATRITLVVLARLIEWRCVLTVAQPATLVRWHRQGFRLFWRWKSRRRGRPRIPQNLQQLIAEMATANRTWGEERIAAELRLKLGISVSSRTVRRYMPQRFPSHHRPHGQSWSTFVRNHAGEVLACDFFVSVTATLRIAYVFLVLDVGTRRIVHWNVTEHPTAEWTVQQFRSCVTGEGPHRFIIHDRDRTFSSAVDGGLTAMGLRVLKTPPSVPQANAFCERLIGTVRRECLDFMIVLSERHLRRILAEWVDHYNRGRPHASLGPRVPDPRGTNAVVPCTGHTLRGDHRVGVRPVLSGLHHEYELEPVAA